MKLPVVRLHAPPFPVAAMFSRKRHDWKTDPEFAIDIDAPAPSIEALFWKKMTLSRTAPVFVFRAQYPPPLPETALLLLINVLMITGNV